MSTPSPARSSRTPGPPISPTSYSSGLLATPAGLAWTLSQGSWTPAPHLRRLNRHLTDLATGRIRRLLVSMPPRHGKSELISHWLPVWYLNTWPERRIILATYGAEFAADWGRRVRNTIQEHRASLQVSIAGDSAAANRWHTTAGGGMIAAGAGARASPAASPPSSATSSSWTTFTTCWPGSLTCSNTANRL